MSKFSSHNFANEKALIRVDFNVPLDKKTLEDGGSVILMSHLGRPKEGPEEKYSLKHLVKHLSELLGVEVQYADDCIGQQATDRAAALKPGQVLLLENLRFYK